jgi:serine/threonine-protein kinase PRP4
MLIVSILLNLDKPDNTIVNKTLTNIKICDFGSALSQDEIFITSELVSRFYRPPEIFLGCQYDTKIDIWSIGCTLYELYTGKILFPGRHNNEMLKLIMQVKGKIPNRILKKGQFSSLYFNEQEKFLSLEYNSADKKDYVKELDIPQNPTRDMLAMLKAENTDDESDVNAFRDFLEKCLSLDPYKRLSAIEALLHPFIMNIKY